MTKKFSKEFKICNIVFIIITIFFFSSIELNNFISSMQGYEGCISNTEFITSINASITSIGIKVLLCLLLLNVIVLPLVNLFSRFVFWFSYVHEQGMTDNNTFSVVQQSNKSLFISVRDFPIFLVFSIYLYLAILISRIIVSIYSRIFLKEDSSSLCDTRSLIMQYKLLIFMNIFIIISFSIIQIKIA